jgi:hypothetical protein
MLFDLRHANEGAFRKMDVDMNIYGKIDYSGANDDDFEPCPRVWDPARKCWSDSWKEHLYDYEIKVLQQ